ncbi:hypothetical protein COE80_19495 [Bacillus pseudomycoides]|uniref:phage tail assembly chaperone G n=1 Tax=Bacillus pseudomycoides TaxID=64104 RepID=UPI000BFBC579|nr:hypothetical protein [Bacillus pseudomycoides]PHB23099.1 hypothetical protein COE80_19495 [Bacillus pseudomycoides]PHE37628.1 hypothetical protein COF51_16460 [Bacillus pseudomycoides]
MEIKLLIDGEEKSFKQPAFMPAIRFKQSVGWASSLEKDFSMETLDGAVKFIANDLYNCQFTEEEFWNGVDAGDVTQLIMNTITSPARRAQERMEQVKN